MGVGAVVEAAVGERPAESFVEEQEEQRNLDAFGGEAVGVTSLLTLEQSVALEPAQVVAQLVQAIGGIGEVKGGEDGLMDLLGCPAADMTAAV